jgi:hypothetical protein
MRLVRRLKLAFWGMAGALALFLGTGILVFGAVGLVDITTTRGPSGKDEVLTPLFLALGGILVWIGLRELARLRRVLRREKESGV